MPRIQPEGVPREGKQRRSAWAQDYTLKGPLLFRTKEKVQCLCEGGPFCYRENPAKQRGANAISGLHSNWVGDQGHILAMARPWQDLVIKQNIVDSFLKHNVGMVLCLQEVGEHESCGPGNLKHTGFSYDPETFMAARIGFYNFSWRDMGVPDLDKLMDIVQVMDYVTNVEGRKIAVHCHAGLGRTGLAIACYFLYTHGYTARRAVEAVRKDRPGALQTHHQVMFVYIFEQYMAHLRCLFPADQLEGEAAAAAAAATASPAPAAPAAPQQHQQQPATSAGAAGPAPIQVTETISGVTEVYGNGLVIVRPLHAHGHGSHGHSHQSTSAGHHGSNAAAHADKRVIGGSGDEFSEEELGLNLKLPWNENFHIQPKLYNKEWTPEAPHCYEEALKRQQRVLHGPERRAYVHLHRFVKEAVFALIRAAQAHSALGPQAPQQQQQQQARAAAAPAAAAPAAAPLATPPPAAAAAPPSAPVAASAPPPPPPEQPASPLSAVPQPQLPPGMTMPPYPPQVPPALPPLSAQPAMYAGQQVFPGSAGALAQASMAVAPASTPAVPAPAAAPIAAPLQQAAAAAVLAAPAVALAAAAPIAAQAAAPLQPLPPPPSMGQAPPLLPPQVAPAPFSNQLASAPLPLAPGLSRQGSTGSGSGLPAALARPLLPRLQPVSGSGAAGPLLPPLAPFGAPQQPLAPLPLRPAAGPVAEAVVSPAVTYTPQQQAQWPSTAPLPMQPALPAQQQLQQQGPLQPTMVLQPLQSAAGGLPPLQPAAGDLPPLQSAAGGLPPLQPQQQHVPASPMLPPPPSAQPPAPAPPPLPTAPLLPLAAAQGVGGLMAAPALLQAPAAPAAGYPGVAPQHPLSAPQAAPHAPVAYVAAPLPAATPAPAAPPVPAALPAAAPPLPPPVAMATPAQQQAPPAAPARPAPAPSAASVPSEAAASAPAAPAWASFAHAFAACVSARQESAHRLPLPSLEPKQPLFELARHPSGYGPRCIGPLPADQQALRECLAQLKRSANWGDLKPTAAAPVLALVCALEDFFAGFEAPSLSTPALAHIVGCYQSLSCEVQPGPEPAQFAQAAEVLQPLPPADQELLLLFAALLRFTAAAGAATLLPAAARQAAGSASAAASSGIEEPMVALGHWVVRLLLGPHLAAHDGAQEAVLSFLWYLVKNDVAYAAMMLLKKGRSSRRAQKGLIPAPGPKEPVGSRAVPDQAAGSAPAGAEGDMVHRPRIISVNAEESNQQGPPLPIPALMHASAASVAPAPAAGPGVTAAADPEEAAAAVAAQQQMLYLQQQYQQQLQRYYGDALPPGLVLPPPSDNVPRLPPGPPGTPPPHALEAASPESQALLLQQLGVKPLMMPGYRASGSSGGGAAPYPQQQHYPVGAGIAAAPAAEGLAPPAAAAAGESAMLQANGAHANGLSPLKASLAAIPTAYIPPTMPTGNVAVHDVWI